MIDNDQNKASGNMNLHANILRLKLNLKYILSLPQEQADIKND